MDLVEKRVHEEFAAQSAIQGNLTTVNGTTANGGEAGILVNGTSRARPRVEPMDVPFAKVNSVLSDSPAETAGLKAGDEIRNFGYVNHSNNEGLRRLADVVQGNEGVSACMQNINAPLLTCWQRNVLIKVSRLSTTGPGREELRLTLTPRRDWGGRGMLGCHVLPL